MSFFCVFWTTWQAGSVIGVTAVKLKGHRLTTVMANVSINSCKSCQRVLEQDTFYAISTLTFMLL